MVEALAAEHKEQLGHRKENRSDGNQRQVLTQLLAEDRAMAEQQIYLRSIDSTSSSDDRVGRKSWLS